MTIDQFLSHLQGVKKHGANQWQALCPAHQDDKPSLSVKDADGTILLFCFAGCLPKQILDSLDLTFRDLWADNPEDIYQYRNSKGNLSHEKVKYRDAKGNKTFTQRHIAKDGKLIKDIKGVPRIPYNHPQVIIALKRNDLIVYTEGEKDANTAVMLGYIGTTMGGAAEWDEDYIRFFQNAQIAVIADKDDAGIKLAQRISGDLIKVSKSVKVVILPQGKDLTEWVELGHGREHLEKLIEGSPELVKPKILSEPEITESISGYILRWPLENVEIRASRLRTDRGGLTAEITIHDGGGKLLLPASSINLLAERTRTEFAHKMMRQSKEEGEKDWDGIITQLAFYIGDMARSGELVDYLKVSDDEEVPVPEYLLKPILLKGVPTVIFGEKGVNKSQFALYCYICLTLPWYNNPLGLEPSPDGISTLILDWEQEAAIVQYYAQRMLRGMRLDPFTLQYRRCYLPLAEDIEQVQNRIEETKAQVIIIDSLAGAAGGDLNKPETALNFFSALRKLKVTSLIIAQETKDQEAKRKSIFGSVFYTYNARSIFQLLKPNIEDEADYVRVSLFHRWFNYGRKQPPLGIGFSYNGSNMMVERQAVDLREYMQRISLQQGILTELKTGSKLVTDIVEATGSNRNTVQKTLSVLKGKGLVVSLEKGLWGLPY